MKTIYRSDLTEYAKAFKTFDMITRSDIDFKVFERMELHKEDCVKFVDEDGRTKELWKYGV